MYASNKSVHVRSVANPAESIQYTAHAHTTTVAKFSPSGSYVASGDSAGNVKVWSVDGEEIITKSEFPVLSGRINDLTWDADSQRIIAVGDGKEKYGHCFTWDSGNTVGEISGHTDVVNAVSIRPVRPYRAVTVADDGNMVFFEGPPFKFKFTSRGNHNNFVTDVRFSPDGAYIVSVGADRKVTLYDGKTGETLKQVDAGHEGSILSVAWSSDSKHIATASADATVTLVNVEDGSIVHTWRWDREVPNHQVGVVFATDDKVLVSLSLSGDLNFLNVENGEVERIVRGHQGAITALAAAEDGRELWTGSFNGRILRWNDDGSAQDPEGNGHTAKITAIVDDGKGLWSTAWDDTLKQASGKFQPTTDLGQQPVSTSAHSGRVAVATESCVMLYESGSKVASADVSFAATAIAVCPGTIVVGSSTGSLHAFDDELKPKSVSFANLRGSATFLSVSPSGEYLAAGDATGKTTLFKVADGSVVTNRWIFNTSRVSSIAWHPDGDVVAVGSTDTNLIIYSVKASAKNIRFHGAHKDGVEAVAWTSSTTFASAGADACVKNWQVDFGALK